MTSGENFGRSKTGQESDLYVANMAPGLTRDQALTQLTELAGGEGAGLADTAPIFDFDISPDGDQVAFATVRTHFPLGFPAFVSTPAGEPGMNELFDADLADGTLTRVTHGYRNRTKPANTPTSRLPAGEDPYKAHPGDGALSPSFTDDGDTLAFSSTASNLVFGDGNSPPLGLPQTGSFDGSDAFTVQRVVFGATPTPNEATPAPEPAFAPAWNLGVTATLAGERERCFVRAGAGAGTVRAGARGAVVAAFVHVARTASRGRHAATPSSRARVPTPATRGLGRPGRGSANRRRGRSPRRSSSARSRRGRRTRRGGTDAADARARSPLRLAGARTGRALGDGHGHVLRAGTRDADGHDPGDVRAREEEELQEALRQGQRQEQER